MPFATVAGARIEYERVDVPDAIGPIVVMLHEGLGSVSMWRDFPSQVAHAIRSSVVTYSRHGYGRSERLATSRTIRYMHEEALVVLPEFLDQLGIENPLLLGHSDGASIALIHAGGSGLPVAGIVALAPHVMVEKISVSSIATAKQAYKTTDLRERLARHHCDVDHVFHGWSDIWLRPDFRSWSIEEYLPNISCRILAIQGNEDEYGTMDQIERIARSALDVEILRVGSCRHSPHRDQPKMVLDAIIKWLRPQLAPASLEAPHPP